MNKTCEFCGENIPEYRIISSKVEGAIGSRIENDTSHNMFKCASNLKKQKDALAAELSEIKHKEDVYKGVSNNEWLLSLNSYQRVNLLWLFEVIGYPVSNQNMVEPLQHLNTGDWLGEIALKLKCFDKTSQPPNVSVEQLRFNIEHWINQRIKNG